MKFSVSKDLVNFKAVETEDISDLCDVITAFNWSPAIYKDSYRRLDNFLETQIIGLDVDDGLTLEEALELFKDKKHIIATTKSHQKEKNGVTCDRFRVVLFLDQPIADKRDFGATWHQLATLYPFIDPQAKDASRFFYPSSEIVSVNETGSLITVVKAPPEVPKEKPKALTSEQKGKLARATLEFLVQGAAPGTWNHTLFKAAKDWQEQGYEQDDFIARAEQIEGWLDESSLKTIASAWSKAPLYEPRVEETTGAEDLQTAAAGPSLILTARDFVGKSLSFLKDKDKVYGEPTGLDGLDQLLGGGKRFSEITALTASAKAGKSALTHYLIFQLLKRGVPVGFASREMSPESEVTPNFLSLAFGENAWKKDISAETEEKYIKEILSWPIYYTKGYGYLSAQEFKAWASELIAQGVKYFVLDHLLYAMSNPEDFKEVSIFMREIKAFVNEQNIHLDLIIQPKNIGFGEKIGAHSLRGGANISQAINNLLVFERVPDQKNISKLTLEFGRSRLCKPGSIYLQYDQETTGFTEVDMQPDEPEFEGNSNVYKYDFGKKVLS